MSARDDQKFARSVFSRKNGDGGVSPGAAGPIPAISAVLDSGSDNSAQTYHDAPTAKDQVCGEVAILVQFYNGVFRDRGFQFPPHLFPIAKALCDQRIRKLMIIVGPGSGKSNMTTVIYPAFALGRDPSLTVLEVSGGEALVKDFMKSSMGIIEHSATFKELFPDVKPDKDATWSVENGASVTGHKIGDPDSSLYAAGLSSSAVVGKHAKLLIFDDLHNRENSATAAQCEKVVQTYYNTLLGRADPGGARFVITGRRWNEDDLYGNLQKTGDWVVLRLPFEREASTWLYYDVYVPDGQVNVFTEEAQENTELDLGPWKDAAKGIGMRHLISRYGVDPLRQGFFWPQSEQKRSEYNAAKRAMPGETQTIYQCNPGGRTGSVFLASYFRYYEPPERLADGIMVIEHWLPPGSMIFQSWDTAYSATSTSDYSVCITGAFVPCDHYHRGEDVALFGPCDPHMDVYILHVYREQLGFDGLVPKAREQQILWVPQTIYIEKKASGISLIQTLTTAGLNIEGVKADINKRARAVNGVGAGSVQGWYSMGRVIHPSEAPWLKPFETELKDFVGDDSGKDDQVDATVHLVTAAIRLGAGGVILPTGYEKMSLPSSEGPVQDLFQQLMLDVVNPFAALSCKDCEHYEVSLRFCGIHHRRMTPMDMCDQFSSGFVVIQ